METRANYLLIGSFVIIVTLGLVAGLLWLTRIGFDRNVRTYDVLFEGSVSGLGLGGDVTYRGIKVGEVQALAIDPDDPTRVRVTVEINNTPIRVGDVATLELQGITGVTFVNIEGAKPEDPLLVAEPGQPHPVIPARPSAFDELMANAPDLLSKMNLLLDRVGGLFSEENLALINGFLKDVNAATQGLSRQQQQLGRFFDTLDATRDDIELLTSTLARTAGSLEGLIGDTRETVGVTRQTVTNMNEVVSKDVRDTLTEYRQTAVSLRSSLDTVAKLLDDNRQSIDRFAGEGLGELTALARETRVLAGRLTRLTERLNTEGLTLLGEPPTAERVLKK
jgi:phospholipid/cholesterol/gamma-HCH transport system substrate-binding protein